MDRQKSELNFYPIAPEEKPTTQYNTTISSVIEKVSTLPIIRSIPEEKTVVFIPDLPFNESNTKLGQMIRSRLSDDHHVHITNVICYSNISVGMVYLASETDKNYLVKNLRSTILDPQTNTIIQFVKKLELSSYLVLDQNMKIVITPDEVACRWQQLCKLSHLPTCELVTVQFPNIFKIVSRSLDE